MPRSDIGADVRILLQLSRRKERPRSSAQSYLRPTKIGMTANTPSSTKYTVPDTGSRLARYSLIDNPRSHSTSPRALPQLCNHKSQITKSLNLLTASFVFIHSSATPFHYRCSFPAAT